MTQRAFLYSCVIALGMQYAPLYAGGGAGPGIVTYQGEARPAVGPILTSNGLTPMAERLAKETLADYSGDRNAINLVADNADYAFLSSIVYNDLRKGQKVLRDTWTVRSVFEFPILGQGVLNAAVFTSGEQAVLAFRGTDGGIAEWGVTNGLSQLVPQMAGQSRKAEEIARSVVNAYPNIHIVGHSLGGRLAQVAASEINRPAVVFDSSPLAIVEATKVRQSGVSVIGFRAPGDVVSILSSGRDIEVANFEGVPKLRNPRLLPGGFDPIRAAENTGTLIGTALNYHEHGQLAIAMLDVKNRQQWIRSIN